MIVSSQVAGASILCAVPRTRVGTAQALSSTKEKALYTHMVDFSLAAEAQIRDVVSVDQVVSMDAKRRH